MQLTSFCKSWILALSSMIVFWSSVYFLLESSRTFNTWLFCNSSTSRTFLIRVSRRARFYSDSSSWSCNWSRLDCSLPAIEWSISIRWESIIPVNSWYFFYQTRLEVRASGSQKLLQQEFAPFVFSRRILTGSFSRSRLDLRFWDKFEFGSYTGLPELVRVRKDWAGNKLSAWEW